MFLIFSMLYSHNIKKFNISINWKTTITLLTFLDVLQKSFHIPKTVLSENYLLCHLGLSLQPSVPVSSCKLGILSALPTSQWGCMWEAECIAGWKNTGFWAILSRGLILVLKVTAWPKANYRTSQSSTWSGQSLPYTAYARVASKTYYAIDELKKWQLL